MKNRNLTRGMGSALCVAGWLGAAGFGVADSALPKEPFGKKEAPQCVVCHSLEKNGPFRSAPNLWGIVGAEKARHDWFGYSTALKTKGGTWTEEALDKYFENPTAYVPGTKKSMTPIADPETRAELIDFLKTLQD
ncbi:cytochrome c family protein [Motiliproteus sp. SC1-56]|uniref:c-type cytochrome n=1 Tax=Motiliproteus sp. SC1-56 TaxID=2799565 RepID=UPI001A8F903F|nr:c-type cytochrome [Motiliproteus sp. SC1-56]